MTGYWINNLTVFAWLVFFIITIPLIGFWVALLEGITTARLVGWLFVVGAVLFVEKISTCEPYGTRMLLIVITLLWSMKAVVYIEARHHGRFDLTFGQWFGFCVCWFGMRAESFKDVPNKSFSDWRAFIQRGWIRVVVGCVLVAAAWIVAHGGYKETKEIELWRRWTATVLLLPGLSLSVHFGFFNILTGIWRYFGARCSALFRAPLLSQSLSEFWSRRWNLAFSEMTAMAVFRPLRQLRTHSKEATALALIGSFLFSGLLHELAISVPVGEGFGFPMLYFLIHGIGILIEKRLKILNSVFYGRIWTAAWVLLPLPILFHRPFLEGCVWPIIRM